MSPALETQRHSMDANDNQTQAWRTSDDARDTDASRTMKWLGYSETNSRVFLRGLGSEVGILDQAGRAGPKQDKEGLV